MSPIDQLRAELPADYRALTGPDDRLEYWLRNDELLYLTDKLHVNAEELLIAMCERHAIQAGRLRHAVELAGSPIYIVTPDFGPCQN